MDSAVILAIAINAIPLIFAITVHEVAHGYVAGKLGDPTARMMGRLTLNPVAHIDPVGTVILPLLQLVMHTGTLFGWARPVPVNFANLRRPRRDTLLVAFAGPGSNFLQFTLWAIVILVIKYSAGLPASLEIGQGSSITRITVPLIMMAVAGLRWNFWLGVLNLIPILPLDGGRMLNSVLPYNLSKSYSKLEPFGFFILIFVLYTFGSKLEFLFVPFQAALNFLLS
jgi:Zn-dependent protease